MSDDYIYDLVQKFELGTLTEEEWDHRAHLLMCLFYLNELSYYKAVLNIKTGIIHFNKAVGIKNTLKRGYHETLTLFWIWSIYAFWKKFHKTDNGISKLATRLLASPYGMKYLPFFFYSEDLLFSPESRVTWVDPDLNPLKEQLITEAYPKSMWYGA